MSVVQQAENSDDYELTPEYQEFVNEVDSELMDIFDSLYGRREINNELTEYSVDTVLAGGKRFRPLAYKAAAEAFGVDQTFSQKAKVASVPEWLHTETLNLDDWQDDDKLRRGERAPHRRLEGDLNLDPHTAGSLISNHVLGLNAGISRYISNSEEFSHEYRNQLGSVISDAVIDLVNGQNLDIVGEEIDNNNIDTDYLLSQHASFVDGAGAEFDQYYIDMVDLKTGALLRAPFEAAALAAGYEPESEVMEQAQELGTYIGRAFQKWDDALDIMAAEGSTGKDRFSDLYTGKKNIVTERAAKMAENGEHGFIEKIRRKAYPTENELLAAGRMIEEAGVVDAVRQDALKDVEKAHQIIDQLPLENPKYADDLRQLAAYTVMRDN